MAIQDHQVIIIGGGMGGLLASIMLAKSNVAVALLEKKTYPFHRVCGEYISNETAPLLAELGVFPDQFQPPQIRRFQLSSISGRTAIVPLDLGGFGVSRYSYDHFLAGKARSMGVNLQENTRVEEIDFREDNFIVTDREGKQYRAPVVLGAYGKREKLDKKLERSFIQKRTYFLGVKYHLEYDFPDDLIALHNFPGGYCGISQVEDSKVNLCYLGSRKYLRQSGSIEQMEQDYLMQNPHLKQILTSGKRLFEKPMVINEISFAKKDPVWNHILMIGDTAGLITPLCGNGMAMAIHGAKLAFNQVSTFLAGNISRNEMESRYATSWRNHFSNRLWVGRTTQHLFGNEPSSRLGVFLLKHVKPVSRQIIKATHGQPISLK